MAEEKLIGLDLSVASEEVIRILLDDPSDTAIFSEIMDTNTQRPEILRLLYDHPLTPVEIAAEAASLLSLPARITTGAIDLVTEEKEEVRLQKKESILQRVQRLSVGQRIQLALKGGKDIRNVLIRDPNREVVIKVLENPKITENEVEMIARNPSSPDDALRFIFKKKDWIRKYNIVLSLASNPKTPIGISMPLITRLRMHDLVILEKNKNIPEAVRSAVKRYLKMRKK
ncbi:hypothetical protein MNBD_NITROSPIRAE02-272 [hydrothermal vent metagenome]|uniref:DUF2336 domain-containing protein n=1 Tax=hydrothermal vent metagenome TaxID=652676 RepID=A0A3B1CC16_9ZZZZ